MITVTLSAKDKITTLLNEKKGCKSGKLFVMKSPYAPKHMPYDHIGFICDDGKLIDMSGHRYTEDGEEPLPPKKYNYEDTEELFKMPKNKEEAIKKGLYKEIPLPKGVEIPPEVPTCSIDKNKAGNCGSFVKIVLSNNGIETTESNDMTDIASAVANKTEAGKEAFKDPRKKPKTNKTKKTGSWWNKASDTRKKAYIKKYGGAPNESIIKLKDIIKEATGTSGAGNSDNGGQWGAPGKVRKLRGFELPRGWAQIDNGPKADNPFGKNTEYRKDTHDIEIPDNYYQPIESDDYVTSGVDEKGENFVQAKAKKSEYSAFGKSMIDEFKSMNLKMMLKNILSEAKFDKVAAKVWDEIISNKIHISKDQLKALSDEYSKKGHYNKKEVYKAVKRVAKQKNWFTKFISKTVKV